jgi:hypothetical protein
MISLGMIMAEELPTFVIFAVAVMFERYNLSYNVSNTFISVIFRGSIFESLEFESVKFFVGVDGSGDGVASADDNG